MWSNLTPYLLLFIDLYWVCILKRCLVFMLWLESHETVVFHLFLFPSWKSIWNITLWTKRFFVFLRLALKACGRFSDSLLARSFLFFRVPPYMNFELICSLLGQPRKLGGPSEKVRIQGLATGLMPEEKRQVRVTH